LFVKTRVFTRTEGTMIGKVL